MAAILKITIGIERRFRHMAVSDSRRKASQKYIKEKLDEIKFRVPKGQREIIQAHAASRGESTNAFIFRAIREQMERDEEK